MKRIFFTLLCALFLSSCVSADDGGADTTHLLDGTGSLGGSYLFILDTFEFIASEDGVALGFNLDGKISDEHDESTCGQSDLVDPDGTEGIDNQLAKVVPLFDLIGVGAALDYAQNSIEGGGLLIMIQLNGVDDPQNDQDVELVLRAGFGVPLLGTDGKILANQTFHLHPSSPEAVISGATLTEGLLEAGPFVAVIPFVVFGMDYQLTFHSARIRAHFNGETLLSDGVMGGGVSLNDLYAIGETAALDDGSVLPAIKTLFSGMADLAPDEDGVCQQVSSGIAFAAVPAYFYPGEDNP